MGKFKKYQRPQVYPVIEEVKPVIEKKVVEVVQPLQDYHFPDEGVTIQARNQKEAYEKLKILKK